MMFWFVIIGHESYLWEPVPQGGLGLNWGLWTGSSSSLSLDDITKYKPKTTTSSLSLTN